jgi:RNA polymerase sigma factor FliA
MRRAALRLVAGNLDYVRGMAGQMRRSLPAAIEIDDLVGYGAIGLCESAARFDRASGARFSTYSHMRIRGAILDGVRLMGWFGQVRVDEDVAAQPAPLSAAEFELAAAVRHAVAALPYEARRLIELHYFEDRPLEECGNVLGVSKSWASRLRTRALALLGERLGTASPRR